MSSNPSNVHQRKQRDVVAVQYLSEGRLYITFSFKVSNISTVKSLVMARLCCFVHFHLIHQFQCFSVPAVKFFSTKPLWLRNKWWTTSLSLKSLLTCSCIQPGSFTNMNQELWRSEHNYETLQVEIELKQLISDEYYIWFQYLWHVLSSLRN